MVHLWSSKLRFWSPTPFVKNTAITCVICSTFVMCGCARTFVSYLVAHLTGSNEELRNGIHRITNDEASWLCMKEERISKHDSSLIPLTNPVGFLLGGFIMDVYGRKCSITCALLPFAAGWIIIFRAKRLIDFYGAGIIHGIASGMSMTASAYVSEISSSKYRGFFLSLLPLSYMLGTVICSALECLFGWIHSAAFLFALSVLMLVFAFIIPESPYWLILNGYINTAKEVLELIRENGDVINNEIIDIKKCVSNEYNGNISAASIDSQNVSLPPPPSLPFHWKTTNVLQTLWKVRQQIAILTIFAILHKFTGFTPLAQYTVQFFNELRTPLDGKTAAFVHTTVCFISTFTVPYFMHNFNKRPLLFVTSIAAGLSICVTLTYELDFKYANQRPYNWITLIGIYGYDMAITVGITSILVMMPAELLPTEVSGIGCAIFNIIGSAVSAVAVKTYLALFTTIGLLNMLSSFILCCFAMAFLSVTILPETHGKTLNEIQKTYFNRADAKSANNSFIIPKVIVDKVLMPTKLATSNVVLPV